MSELEIKISGDTKEIKSALNETDKEVKKLNESMKKLSIGSAIAFAGLAAGIYKSTTAVREEEIAISKLTQSLKNQGIENQSLIRNYVDIANQLEILTGFQDEAFIRGQSLLQNFIGQNEISKELALAVADLAAGLKIDLESAFQLLGKSVTGSVNILSRYGVSLDTTASVQEKLSQFMSESNRLFGGQAKAAQDAKGPSDRLRISLEDLTKEIGRNLLPAVDLAASLFLKLSEALRNDSGFAKLIAGAALAGTAITGIIAILPSLSAGFAILTATVTSLGAALLALEAPVVLLGVGLAALAGLSAKNLIEEMLPPKTIEELTVKIKELNKELEDLRKKQSKSEFFGDQSLKIQDATAKLTKYEAALAALKKSEAIASGTGQRTEEQERTAQQVKARQKLAKDLADVGLSELDNLKRIRDERLKIAGEDASLRLKIEKDFQIEKSKLEKEAEKERTDRLQKELQIRKEINQSILTAAGAPFQRIETPENLTAEQKQSFGQNVALGRTVGIGNLIAGGAQGAKSAVTGAAGLGLDLLAPGLGQAAQPLLQALAGGPEATRAFVREFVKSVPIIIEALIDAIPVFIEELVGSADQLISKLVELSPRLISSLSAAAPEIGLALAKEMPQVALSFSEALVGSADDFVEALIDSVKSQATGGLFGGGQGGGGVLSDIGGGSSLRGGLALATGGLSELSGIGTILDGIFAGGGEIPAGFQKDNFIAGVSSGEYVIDRSLTEDLKSYLGKQGGPQRSEAIFARILDLLESPMQVSTSVELNQREFANIILNLNRNAQRLT
jgi:hypothetical protein